MKQTLRKWCFAMAAVCILIFMMGLTAFAADGTASLSDTTMTESGSITVSFSETATGTSYYNVQIADSEWSTTYVNTNITSGDSYTIAGYSAGTYQIYIGYWEDGSWKSDALSTTTFTVTEDNVTAYGVTLSVSEESPALGDNVTVTATIKVNGSECDGIPDGCSLSIWYENDTDWVTPVDGSSTTTSTTISLSSDNFTEGNTYTVQAALYDSDWNTLASGSMDFTVIGTGSGGVTDTYDVSIIPSATTCEQNESLTFTIIVTYGDEEIDLTSQSDVYLWVWADSWADGHSDGLTDCSISPNTGLANSVTIEFPSVGTYYIAYTLEDSSYAEISKSTDVAAITVTESTVDPSEEITTGDLSCGFMRGMDLSTFYTNWEKGAVYYDYEGNEYSKGKGNAVDFFKFLYNECGVNWVRLRVWNDLYDEDSNPYGGGNNDVATAAIIGKWASDAGMTVLIDFHYSDFWADPGRQLVPKAWTEMDINEKVDALYEYTYDSLEYLLDAGVNVGMVQVGNETNGAFCGEEITTWSDYDTNEDWRNICALFSSGSKAVRDISADYGTDIKVALHFTNPNNANPSWYAGLLDAAGVDYDAMGISYYMYWHGTLSNLQSEIETISNTYGKEVFIAETAYPYTSENYDDCGNQVTSFDDFDMNANLYAISEAGQEAALTAILDTAANSSGCTGMFYWEPAWTTLPDTYDEGTGWATKWASDYISYSMDASEGTSFDNQALFDDNGKALAALKFYVDYVKGVENLQEHTYVLDEDASTAATCTTDGEKVYVCSVCGDSYTVTVSATGHTTETQNAKDATCTEDGYTGDAVCTVCGETITTGETIPATGHDYEANAVVASTYEEQGYTVYTCTHCGDSYEADYTAVKVIDGTDGNLSTKTTVQELTAVPEGLKNLYSSVDALVSDLISRVTVDTGYTEDNALMYDVVLQYSTDGGTTWITATVDNFPADGITVTIPYPEGTDASYEFVVEHMFTVTSERLGITAGDTERPIVTKTDDGLVVTLMGLSPVAVSWKAVTTSTTETDTSSQTDTTTESTDTSGTSASSTTSAQTGDNSLVALWFTLLSVSGAGVIGAVVFNKKRKYSR